MAASRITRTLRLSNVVNTECLLALFLYIITLTHGQRVTFVEPNAPSNAAITLQRMVLEKSTGEIYVGSVNTMYKLTENLEIVFQERTGPVQDNVDCFPPPGPCTDGNTRQTMDNINKLLVIDGDILITCGSVYQGTCQTRNLTTFAILRNNTQEEVSVNTPHGTTVGFIGNGPMGNVLYVASSHSLWIDSGIPTISSRRIVADVPKDLFKVFQESQFSRGAKITIPAETFNNVKFNITYVYGFPSGNFSYFIGVQPVDETIPESYYRTKLARVCQHDSNYYSYIELPLVCKKGKVNYNLAQSAYVTRLGADLDNADFRKGEIVLFVTFAKSNLKTLDVLEESAICMYSIKVIDSMFWQTRRDCATGSISGSISWQGSQNQGCFNTPLMVERIDKAGPQYCHLENFLYPLGGETPIEAEPIFNDTSLLTALAATPYQDETVIFAGDRVGNVKKLRIIDATTAKFVEEESVVEAGDEQLVGNGLMFNRDANFLYAMTPTKRSGNLVGMIYIRNEPSRDLIK